ncbi:MAG: TadE/TadG family type IV pilus assembly protein, partial [Hyphomicrobiaceae bacterium]
MRLHPKFSELGGDLSTAVARDERGSIGMMFALTMFGTMMAVGCAFDLGRAMQAKQGLAAALDTATIAAAKGMKDGSSTEDDVQTLAKTFFDTNASAAKGIAKVTSFKVNINKSNNTVTSTIESHVPTAFARIAGIDKIDLPVSSTAMYNQQDIEVGLQLDVTGSMSSSIKGRQKLASLKEASNDLFDILLPDGGTGTTKVRIGLAPFDAGVNLGSYASAVSGGSSTSCVYERKSASYDTTDDAPIGFASFKSKADLSGAQNCPTNAKLVPLTDKKATLKAAVATMTPGASTAGHLGTTWAWNLISPKWT